MLNYQDVKIRRFLSFLTTVQNTANLVVNNIQYMSDMRIHGRLEYWQLPEETFELGTGDCEDMSILLMNLLRKKRIDSKLTVGTYRNFIFSSGHAWVTIPYGNLLITVESTSGKVSIGLPPKYTFSHHLEYNQVIEKIRSQRLLEYLAQTNTFLSITPSY